MATLTFTPIVGADGKATATIKVANGLDQWTINQVSAKLATAPLGATCELDLNGYMVSPIVPTGDALEGTPITLKPSDVLTVQWAGCTPGTAAQVLVVYDDGRG